MDNLLLNRAPGKIVVDYHTTIVQCHCLTPERMGRSSPMVIVGWGGVICPNCQRLWTAQPKEGGGVNLLMTPPGQV